MPETNYEKALNQALTAAFASLRPRDLKDTAFKSGAAYEGDEHLKLPYLNGSLHVEAEQEEVRGPSGPAGKRTSILALHYLLRASGRPLTGRMIGFTEVPQGGLYFRPFRNRVIFPMLALVDKDPATFEACARQLGAEPVQAGDLSLRFRVFPYVTAQFVWHRGEEGVPSDLAILFDASISEYLATEDIVVMCEEINGNMKSLWDRKTGPKAEIGKDLS